MAIPPAANEGSEVWQGHIGVQTFFKKKIIIMGIRRGLNS